MNYKDFFALAKQKNIDNIQVTEKTKISSSFELINGITISYEDCNNIDYIIKAEVNGKTVKTKTEYLSEEILEDIIINIENTDSSYEDDYLENTENIPQENTPNIDVSKELKELKKCSNLIKDYPQIDKLTIVFEENYENTKVINSNSVNISSPFHIYKIYAEATADNNGNYISFNKELLETDKRKINFSQFINDVLQKTIISLNKEKIATSKYSIVIDSAVAGSIISILEIMASAANIRNKTSCLEKKIDEKVFSENITIIENPGNKKYPGYCLFDDEGTKTCKKTIIDKGIFKTQLFDIKEARIKKTNSTGNAFNGIGTKNMYILPGNRNLEELFKEMNDGIYITDYMGSLSTSINPVTGNISLHVFGFAVKNGKIVSGIEPCIMTTTIFELLSNVREIGSDLQFIKTSTASPSLLIDDISIVR